MKPLFTIAGCSALSLLLVAVAMGVVFAVSELFFPSELWTVVDALWVGFCVTLLLGTLPVLLLGAPAYWLLWRAGRVDGFLACVAGTVLGSFVVVVDPAFVFWGAGCGLATGLFTHLLLRYWAVPAAR